MKVKELIKELNKFPQDAIVLVTSTNFELNYSDVALSYIYAIPAKKIKREFRDAFDGESYHKDIYVYDENGDNCVKIS